MVKPVKAGDTKPWVYSKSFAPAMTARLPDNGVIFPKNRPGRTRPVFLLEVTASMKPTYQFSIYTCFLILIVANFWYPYSPELSPLKREKAPAIIALPLQNTSQLPVSLSPKISPSIQGDRPVAVPMTAPTAVANERILPNRSTGSQALGLPLVKKAPAFPFPSHSKGLHDFIGRVMNQNSLELRGVYVENVLALPIVQQPKGDPGYVDTQPGTVTQFHSAAKEGVTGLLAHNYLSGKLFLDLEIDQEVNLIYGDGLVFRYRITHIQSYQKLEGDLKNSHYVNLASGENLSTLELFKRMYSGEDKVTFQTCIKKGSDWSWGRIFIIATPLL
jgi:hypothetical protein